MLDLDELIKQINEMQVTEKQIEELSNILKEKELEFERNAYERLLK